MKMLAKWMFVAIVAVVLAACSDDRRNSSGSSNHSDDATLDASDSVDTPAPIPDATRDPNGPEVLEFSVSPQRLTEGGEVTLTVAITDPQGFGDIGGGRIIDDQGEAYGVFSGSGGTFSATLTWQQIDNVSRIDFEEAQTRLLIAEFFDSSDNRTTHPFQLELHCNGGAACDGSCGASVCNEECTSAGISCQPGSCVSVTDLNTAESCGACGNVCSGESTCSEGECVCTSDFTTCGDSCVDLSSSVEHCGQCDNACADTEACADGGCVEPVGSDFPCATHADCPAGYCDERQGCVIPCADDGTCVSDLVCFSRFNNTCFQPCSSVEDCPSQFRCLNLFEKTGSSDFPDEYVCLSE